MWHVDVRWVAWYERHARAGGRLHAAIWQDAARCPVAVVSWGISPAIMALAHYTQDFRGSAIGV